MHTLTQIKLNIFTPPAHDQVRTAVDNLIKLSEDALRYRACGGYGLVLKLLLTDATIFWFELLLQSCDGKSSEKCKNNKIQKQKVFKMSQ